MVDLDTAFTEAMAYHNPAWTPPDVSALMLRERAELVDIEPDELDAEDVEDFTVDD